MNKSAAAVLEGLNTYDACVQEVDNFIDGVESGIKAAGLNNAQGASVWAQIGTVLEKVAAEDQLTPEALQDLNSINQIELPGSLGDVPQAPTGSELRSRARQSFVPDSMVGGLTGAERRKFQAMAGRPVGEALTGAEQRAMLRPAGSPSGLTGLISRIKGTPPKATIPYISKGMTPVKPTLPRSYEGSNAMADASPEQAAIAGDGKQDIQPKQYAGSNDMAEGSPEQLAYANTPQGSQAPVTALDRLKGNLRGIDWKGIGGNFKNPAIGGGLGALAGVLGTAALAKPDKEGRKPYLRNALLGLAGGAGAGALASHYMPKA